MTKPSIKDRSLINLRRVFILFICCTIVGVSVYRHFQPDKKPSTVYIQKLDQLSALWSFYKFRYIQDGRVISPDEGNVTTSEGQGYGMLRAVWSNDPNMFSLIWKWSKANLQIRNDNLFAWKWSHGKVADKNAATDADCDIALALILASRRFNQPEYRIEAQKILDDIWNYEVLKLDGRNYITGGNWAPHEKYPTIHTAYLAPYIYEIFSEVDGSHNWETLITSSYEVLEWIYFDKNLSLPPEHIYIDKKTGRFILKRPNKEDLPRFSYDAYPIFWRIAVDHKWFYRDNSKLAEKMLHFFRAEWEARGRFVDIYSLSGRPLSHRDALPLYSTIAAMARQYDPELANQIETEKLFSMRSKAQSNEKTPYYLQNWLWFDRGLELDVVRHFDEFLYFLYPFDWESFSLNFPWLLLAIMLLLFPFCRMSRTVTISFLICAFWLCLRYLYWRYTSTLNFIEPAGIWVSGGLFLAEVYCFTTVLLLLLQVGLKSKPRELKRDESYFPSVDIYIPIYSEPLDILEKTIIGAQNIDYPNFKIHICDDSHQDEVKGLAHRLGVNYIRGPRAHAKAGNINNAMKKTSGELLLIFDTDHIPVRSFLKETVPYFVDSKMGIVQTPHHFYNEDVFQRCFLTKNKVPNEQDMFNHGIQGARNNWGGAFFIGTGALFRRKALDSTGGFKYMSITEDIHTSQQLHARGWKSTFVDKDLAVGLTAENYSSYIIQRRRWMQGCLQIFFKDNPLFLKGLPWRHRLGYFSSLYYFFFPLSRVMFWSAPLFFLFFHWHPLFAEVSISGLCYSVFNCLAFDISSAPASMAAAILGDYL